ncbi:MAG: HAD hydrolase-like protein [Bacteroidaceae bacterium]|nr:HAD hydrolase-like protein [Bacteroidaceae bacterium]
MCKNVVVFDLDDTLYKEIDFLKSGYRKVAELVAKQYGCDARAIYDQLLKWYYNGENAFACLNEEFGFGNPISEYLDIYRYHHPTITLSEETRVTLSKLKEEGVVLGIITDGREITQRQKVEALELEQWISIDMVLINEARKYFKPNRWSYDKMMLKCYEKYPYSDFIFYYVGDNIEKDFIAPNELGWGTICLDDDGMNIHKQEEDLPSGYLPKRRIKNINQLTEII